MYIFTILLWLLSILSSSSLLYFAHWYEKWYLILTATVLLPVFYAVWALILLTIIFIWSLLLGKRKNVDNPSKFYYFFVREITHQIDIFARVKVIISGEDKLPNQKCMIISNHLSMFDAICIVDKFKLQPLSCVTKIENERIPICGPFIHNAGFIPLDRTSPQKAVKCIQRAANCISSDLSHIYICPEGTRSKSGELLPFHAGSFKIATKTNAPIVICNFKNTNMVHKNFPWKRTKVYLDIIDVIYPEQYSDKNTQQIADLCRQIIENYQNKE